MDKVGIKIVEAEYIRSRIKNGWSPEHDDAHENGELANAAAVYALTDDSISFMNDSWGDDSHLYLWPFELKWLKRSPDDRIKDLAKAGNLIVSEIERLVRIEMDKHNEDNNKYNNE